MGLKIGIAEKAARERLYIPIETGANKNALDFAKVFFCVDSGVVKVYFRYLDGTIGHLFFNEGYQFESCFFMELADWVPTKEAVEYMRDGRKISSEMIVFGGSYLVREIPSSDLVPAPRHTGYDRFLDPEGAWNQALSCLFRDKTVLAV